MPEYTTAAEVMARLRLPAGHTDAAFVALCTDAANDLVDSWLERTGTPPEPLPDPLPSPAGKLLELTGTPRPALPPLEAPYPASVIRAATGVAIRIYRHKDAESDVSDSWGDPGALRIPRDPLAGYRDMLAPYRDPAGWAPA